MAYALKGTVGALTARAAGLDKKRVQFVAGCHLLKRIMCDVTQAISIEHVKVARVYVAVALDHKLRRACSKHAALLGRIAGKERNHVIKESDAHATPLLKILEPQAKEHLVKARKCLRGERELILGVI